MQSDLESISGSKLSREEWSRHIKKKKRRAVLILSSITAGCLIFLALLTSIIVKTIIARNNNETDDQNASVRSENISAQNPTETIAISENNTINIGSPAAFQSNTETNSTDSISASSNEEVKVIGAPYTENIEITKAPVPEKGTVIIDAGHGGKDPGAIGMISKESDLNLQIAMSVKRLLTENGYTVIMTRTDDSFVGLSERVRIANAYPYSLCFVSIHQNSVDDSSDVTGTEVITDDKREGNMLLAQTLVDDISSYVGSRNRGVFKYTNLVVIRDTVMPAALVECGFISSEKEEELLSDEEYRSKIAEGIVQGIDNFVDQYY